jgi:hypothetical protein
MSTVILLTNLHWAVETSGALQIQVADSAIKRCRRHAVSPRRRLYALNIACSMATIDVVKTVRLVHILRP